MLSGAILGTEKIAGNMHNEIYHTLDHARPVYETGQVNIGESESGANKIDSFCPFRWWAIEDLMQSDELFVPGKLGHHLHTLLQQGPPAKPFVVGI